MRDVLGDLQRWRDEGEEIAIATLVSAWGSAPRLPGARFAMTRSGRIAGSLSGGCIEGDLFERAMEVLDTGRPRLLEYGISDEMAFEVGLSCGGRIEAFVEPFRADAPWAAARDALAGRRDCVYVTALAPDALAGRHMTLLADAATVGSIDSAIAVAFVPAEAGRTSDARVINAPMRDGEAKILVERFAPAPRLFIVGATHVAAALARQAKMVGFGVTVIDARRLFATPERFPDADEIVIGWPDDGLAAAALGGGDYVVVATHESKFDVPALAAALRSEARYVGLLGSRATLALRADQLRALGFGEPHVARIHAPIGLDLGGRSPEEIALAIAAEMTMARYSAQSGPVHREADG
jgi:xanthine dehydrogenase accessory factor